MGSLRFLIRALVFLLLILTGTAFLIPSLKPVALASPYLNAFILAVLLFGLCYAVVQFFILIKEGRRLESYRQFKGLNVLSRRDDVAPSSLLFPVAALLDQHKYLSPSHIRFATDGVAGHFEESRELAKYIIGLLIFLGLLGTFWGLSQTIGAIAQVITDLPTVNNSMEDFFELLKLSLKKPLSGMGIAFSSSLFGLAGSLILGFVELQVNRAQQDFLRTLEEWLTHLHSPQHLASPEVFEGEAPSVPYVQVFWQHIGEHLEILQKALVQAEKVQGETCENLAILTEKMSKFTDQVQVEQNLMRALAEGQVHLQQSVKDMAQHILSQGISLDEGSRAHLRGIDLGCSQLLKEAGASRKEILQEMRQELRLLGRGLMATSTGRTVVKKSAS